MSRNAERPTYIFLGQKGDSEFMYIPKGYRLPKIVNLQAQSKTATGNRFSNWILRNNLPTKNVDIITADKWNYLSLDAPRKKEINERFEWEKDEDYEH